MLPCAILCGGLATRLRPLTEKIPKSMIPIRGEPFIAYQLRLLESKGIRRVILCTGFLGESIEDFVGNGSRFRLEISYAFDGPEPLGTAGAIRNALPLLGPQFFVLYGDSYLDCDYQAVAQSFAASGKPGLMTIYRNTGRYDTSNVEAAQGSILRYDKRCRTPEMQYIDYGLGAFDQSVFERPQLQQVRDLAEIYQALVSTGELASYEIRERFYEIGSASGIRDFEEYLSNL